MKKKRKDYMEAERLKHQEALASADRLMEDCQALIEELTSLFAETEEDDQPTEE